jgi:hypothetical protein
LKFLATRTNIFFVIDQINRRDRLPQHADELLSSIIGLKDLLFAGSPNQATIAVLKQNQMGITRGITYYFLQPLSLEEAKRWASLQFAEATRWMTDSDWQVALELTGLVPLRMRKLFTELSGRPSIGQVSDAAASAIAAAAGPAAAGPAAVPVALLVVATAVRGGPAAAAADPAATATAAAAAGVPVDDNGDGAPKRRRKDDDWESRFQAAVSKFSDYSGDIRQDVSRYYNAFLQSQPPPPERIVQELLTNFVKLCQLCDPQRPESELWDVSFITITKDDSENRYLSVLDNVSRKVLLEFSVTKLHEINTIQATTTINNLISEARRSRNVALKGFFVEKAILLRLRYMSLPRCDALWPGFDRVASARTFVDAELPSSADLEPGVHLLVPLRRNYPLVDAVIIVVRPPPERAAKNAASKGMVVVGAKINLANLTAHACALGFVIDKAEGPRRMFLPGNADRESYQISRVLLWISDGPRTPGSTKLQILEMHFPIRDCLS